MISAAGKKPAQATRSRQLRPEQPNTAKPADARRVQPRQTQLPGSPDGPKPLATTQLARSFSRELTREMTGLRGYAMGLCQSRDLADDMIQETLLNAWSARDRFQAGTNLTAWCTRILRNVFYSYKRRSWRTQPLPDAMIDSLAEDDGNLDHRQDLLAVWHAMALLPVEQREALLLVGAGGETYGEAAGVFGCALGTVKNRVSRARARLEELTGPEQASLIRASGPNASDVLDDLMAQAARIKSRASRCSQSGTPAPGRAPPVYPDPVSSSQQRLNSIMPE